MKFPIVDAILTIPEEGKNGKIGICTNSLAPGMVLNEIPFDNREDVSVLGSLVVNRDGTERMILNSLSHPRIEYIILFGEETMSFKPSTNLLLVLMGGYDELKKGNFIKEGKGVSPNYPNIKKEILENFKKRIKVIPLFNHVGSEDIIKNYLLWLRPRISVELYDYLLKINNKKVYYDSLNKIISLISGVPNDNFELIELDPKDFQNLQPPIFELKEDNELIDVDFEVKRENDNIIVNLDVNDRYLKIKGRDSFLIAYSIMSYFNENNLFISKKQQLLLGSEMSRVEVEIKNDIKIESLVNSKISNNERTIIPIASRTSLKADKKYYYKIFIKNNNICIQSLSHDFCETVFELRSKYLISIIKKLLSEDRFEDYEQQFLHRVDVGIELGRAYIALMTKNEFFQDFRNLFTINTKNFPFFITESDSFLNNHQKIITKLYTLGLTSTHPDAHKGPMREAVVLSIYRKSNLSLKNFPSMYGSSSQSSDDMRISYKNQLLSALNDGTYTYGNRTREYFGLDQLESVIFSLKKNKNLPFVIQRFDYVGDMCIAELTINNKKIIESTHDPCLTHDIYFILNDKLYSFHIARAHNIVNAYPENIFGLHDAYDMTIADALGIEMGDMFMLSSRANILLLTEEQKAKRIIAEPSKPVEEIDTSIGPFNMESEFQSECIGYYEINMEISKEKPNHPCLGILENYNGINIINKAINYLKIKGPGHNNPIMGTFNPKNENLNEQNRLIFFQCNQCGGKLYSTAVFINGSEKKLENDIKLCNYISSLYSRELNIELGKLVLFYVQTINE